MSAFACTLCGKCCLNLQERAEPAWPAAFDRNARAGFYGLPTKAGLQVWSWEKRRMERAARERGVPIAFEPSLVVLDDKAQEAVVLVWELATMACPLHVTADPAGFAPPVRPTPEGKLVLCGAYEDRPAVCRAYPVLLRGEAAAWSARCPDAFAPEASDRAAWAATYGDSFAAAEAANRFPRVAQETLRFLETTGDLALARGLAREDVLRRVARGPVVDLLARLERGAAVSVNEMMARLA